MVFASQLDRGTFAMPLFGIDRAGPHLRLADVDVGTLVSLARAVHEGAKIYRERSETFTPASLALLPMCPADAERVSEFAWLREPTFTSMPMLTLAPAFNIRIPRL